MSLSTGDSSIVVPVAADRGDADATGWAQWDLARATWGIRGLLFAALTVAALVPTLAIGGLLLHASMQHAATDAQLSAEAAAVQLERELRWALDSNHRAVRLFAHRLEAATAIDDPVVIAGISGARELFPALTRIVVRTTGGDVAVAIPPGAVPRATTAKNVVDGVATTEDATPQILLRAPVRDGNGALRAVVDGEFDASTLHEAFSASLPQDAQVRVRDSQRQVVIEHPVASRWAWLDAAAATHVHSGQLFGVRAATRHGWEVAIAVPVRANRTSFGLPIDDAWTIVAIAAAALLIAIVGSVTLGRRIVRPLRALGTYAERMQPDVVALPAPPACPQPPPREIASLAQQFRRVGMRMTGSLRFESQLRIELERVLEGREEEIARRTAELQRALAAAESADDAKTTFLATMSHELRTPLTSILGFSDRLLRNVQEAGNRKAAASIHDAATHMLGLVTDLLDVARVESGTLRVELQRVALAPLLREVINLQRMAIEAKGLQFDIETPAQLPRVLHADPMRLRQILLNLLDNATRFTERGHVVLRVRIAADARLMDFDVGDTGRGIAPEQLARLFLPFQQAESGHTRRHGGAGLGLFLSRELARRMGGDITCRSMAGEGSTFTVTMPLATDDGPIEWAPFAITAPRTARHRPAALPKLRGRVLLADDCEHIREVMRLYLDDMGLTCDLAVDGEDALQHYLRETYDLVLLDLHMPRVSGIDAARMIRQLDAEIPIIAVTADLTSRTSQEQADAGITDMVSKPIDPAHLVECVRRHLPATAAATAAPAPLPHVARPDPMEALRAGMIASIEPDYAAPLRDAVAACDWTTVRRVAHRLAGTSGSFGLTALSTAARSLELHLVEHHDEPPDPAFLHAAVGATLARCAEAIAPPTAPSLP